MSGVAFSKKSTNVDNEALSSTLGANEDCIIPQNSSDSPSFFPFGGLDGGSPFVISSIAVGHLLLGNGTCPENT